MLINSDSGIMVEYNGKRIALDPKNATDADLVFVSHAHTDHMHRSSDIGKVLASKETLRIAEARGFKYHNASH
ncbi:MAG: MBL fold metallo-hydrolase, partial [Candidatus Nitrosocaldus sp.]